MTDFPLSTQQDSKFFSETIADPAIGSATEGGYKYTRAKYFSSPKKTFTTGFTDLSNSDKITFQTFWETMYGGSEAFNYTNPTDSQVYIVRFLGAPTYTYAGYGSNFRWNISNITLEEV